jgi:hypothetical protein
MKPDPVIELLHAAYEELHRLEALLQENPVYRRVEALRNLIEEYDAYIVGSRRPDLSSVPKSTLTTSAPLPLHDQSAAPTTVSASRAPSDPGSPHPAADPDAPANIRASAPVGLQGGPRRRGGPRRASQAAQIRDAAAPFLREKGTPARGTEIYEAIRAKGVEVRGKKPSAVVTNALKWSPELFEKTSEGFGLTVWSNIGGSQNGGHS